MNSWTHDVAATSLLCFLVLSFWLQHVIIIFLEKLTQTNHNYVLYFHYSYFARHYSDRVTAFCALSQNKSEFNNRASIEFYRECIKVTSTFPNKYIAICHPHNSLRRQKNSAWRNDLERISHCTCIDYYEYVAVRANLSGSLNSYNLSQKIQKGKWETREKHNYSIILSNGWRDKMTSSCIINKLEFQYLSPCRREDLSQNNH